MTTSHTPMLVIICGPPAVGKMTVGLELSALTGLRLFHNHVSIEAVLPVFDYGTPAFNRLVGNFRDQVFREVAASDLPGLIFTVMWAFDVTDDRESIKRIKDVFDSRGGRTVFVELQADLATRVARNRTKLRLEAKPSKRDVDASQDRLLAADDRHQLNSSGDFPFDEHLKIDNTHLEPRQVADQILAHFDLPTATGEPRARQDTEEDS